MLKELQKESGLATLLLIQGNIRILTKLLGGGGGIHLNSYLLVRADRLPSTPSAKFPIHLLQLGLQLAHL